MFVNWSLESLKWQMLMRPFRRISFLLSFRAVLSGTTISLFTPNRVGEFAGRVLHLEQGFRIKGVIATITGSMSQLLVTIIAGCIALLVYPRDPGFTMIQDREIIQLLASVIPILSVLIFFGLPQLPGLLPEGRFKERIDALASYNAFQLSTAVSISALRYMVFAIQFFLVLRLFNVIIPFSDSIQLIAIIYIVMAIVPTMAVSEIAVRGSVALYFLAPYSGDPAAILAASTLLWLINLALPAGLGALSALWIRLNNR
jgi:uncharacterized membrane protein YbhN (UPF0104 family)